MGQKYYLMVYFIALISLSQSSNLVRWAAIPPDALGFWRLLLSGVLLSPWLWRHHHLLPLEPDHHNEDRKVIPTHSTFKNFQILGLLLVTSLFFFGHLWTYFYSAQNTRISHCMILFATNPLYIAGGSALFLKETIPPRIWCAYPLALLGIVVIALVKESHPGTPISEIFKSLGPLTLNPGDWAALLSAALFAGYILIGKKIRTRMQNWAFSSLIYFLTSFWFLLSGFSHKVSWTGYSQTTWFAIFASVIFPTLLGHSLFSLLYPHLNINLMSCGKMLEPLFSAGVAYWAFNESITSHHIFAFILIGTSILILFWPSKKTK